MAFARDGSGRVALSFIGEGGSSLGEWHEAINLCAARRLPAVFCVQNNQTALSTPVRDQSAVRVFADKAVGYGIPGITIDGTDPDEIAAAFAWAVERARAGHGPTLHRAGVACACAATRITTTCSISARTRKRRGNTRRSTDQGYANRELYAFWSARDPIPAYAARLEAEGVIARGDLDRSQARGARRSSRREARAVIDAPWPEPADAGRRRVRRRRPARRVEVLDPADPRRKR